jgi:hypothetical protein
LAWGTTVDKKWLKIGHKEYVLAQGLKEDDSSLPSTFPLFPSLPVVVTVDTNVYKAPSFASLPSSRLKAGEPVYVKETTADLQWIKLNENAYLPTNVTAPLPHTTPLTPPVRLVIDSPSLEVRNVPSFAGFGKRTLKKGEEVEAAEATSDYKWIKIAHEQYIPSSDVVLHSTEGKDLLLTLKYRSAHVDKDPVVALKKVKDNNQSLTTSQAASLLKQAFEKRIAAAEKATTTTTSSSSPSVNTLENPITQLAIKQPTLVMSEPRADATPVRGLAAGALVEAKGVGTDLQWLEIGTNEFIRMAATEQASA